MAVTPNTDIRLLKVPIELDNKNQLTFANETAQANYFLSINDYLEFESCQYQRKNSVMNIPAHIDSILEYNYVMYKNNNYTNKWFYAFITNMEYENDGLTRVSIETDVFQTWQFDLNWRQSFVEREMIAVADDVAGANLLPENLEIGELKVNNSLSVDDLEPVYIIAFTGDHVGTTQITGDGWKYNGIPSSVVFIACLDFTLDVVLQLINSDGQGDKILTVFTIPKLAIKSLIPVDPPGTTTYWWQILDNDHTELPQNWLFSPTPSALDGYTPKNQKLRTYPFCYLGFNPQNRYSKNI